MSATPMVSCPRLGLQSVSPILWSPAVSSGKRSHKPAVASSRNSVWQKLEEQNQEFFKGYHLRLMVKDQIMEFNKLLDRQAALMQQLGPTGVNFQPKSNGSHLPPRHQNSTCYAPENTGIPLKTESMTDFSRGFNNCGLPIPSGDPQPQSRRIDVPSNMLLAHNSNVGITNRVSVKAEPNYLGNLRLMYGTDGNVVEARPTIGDGSVSSFSCLESDPHQLNGTLLNDGSLFGMLGPMSQSFALSDSTLDLTNSSDMLENFSSSAFLSSDRDTFLDSHSSTLEHQGENKRLDIPENLGFEDFGCES